MMAARAHESLRAKQTLQDFFEGMLLDEKDDASGWNDRLQRIQRIRWGSPKMRLLANWCGQYMSSKDKKEKVLIWVSTPAQQVLVVAALRELNINAAAYHAHAEDRLQLATEFRSPDRIRELVCSYQLNSCGMNLHGNCRNVILLEPAQSWAVETQAVGRARRIGQTQNVRVERFYVKDSWNSRQAAQSRMKALPGIMTDLNRQIFWP